MAYTRDYIECPAETEDGGMGRIMEQTNKVPCHCGEVTILPGGLGCSQLIRGEYVVVTKFHGDKRCVPTGFGMDELYMESFRTGGADGDASR